MKTLPFKKMAFDKGHGETNYEMLRLAIDRGESPMGKKCRGLKHLLPNMMAVDSGSTLEVIDKVTGTASKVLTKNVMVKNAQLLNENGMIAIPACDLKGNIMEDEELRLIGQMRGYVVDKVSAKGEVYASTVRGGLDHRLDAFMLACHAYNLDTSIFFRRDEAAVVDNATGFEHIADVTPGWRSVEKPAPKVSHRNDMTIFDHGLVTRRDPEPEEHYVDKQGLARPIQKNNMFNRSGFKHTARSVIKSNKRRF